MASPASSASRTELRLRQRVLPPSLFAVGLDRLQQHPHGDAPLLLAPVSCAFCSCSRLFVALVMLQLYACGNYVV
ncbi:hypothetical protein ACQJBY_012651 [Aegilops geniculata]